MINAEGAPAESLVNDESRVRFDSVAQYWHLYPQAARVASPRCCAPRIEDGEALEAVRQRLAARALRLEGALPVAGIAEDFYAAAADLPISHREELRLQSSMPHIL